jgi:ABC-type nitrate/sulfonate/bicarbonate transport system substrate-binding protein
MGDLLSEVGPSLATTQAKLKNSPQEVYRIIRASLKGYLFMYRNPDEALKFFMEGQGITDVAAGKDGWQARLRRTSESSRTGMASEEALNDTLQVVKRQLEMSGAGLGATELRSDSVFDFTLVKRAIDELKAENWDPKKYRYVSKANPRQ